MRRKIVVMLAVMLFGTMPLCFGETWNRPDTASAQKLVAAEKPTAKVEIYVTDW